MTPQQFEVVHKGKVIILTIDEDRKVHAGATCIGSVAYSRDRKGARKWIALGGEVGKSAGGYTAKEAATSLFYQIMR